MQGSRVIGAIADELTKISDRKENALILILSSGNGFRSILSRNDNLVAETEGSYFQL